MSKNRTFLPLALLIGFSACTPERPVTVLPPVSLTSCADMPDAPDLPARDGTTAIEQARDQLMLAYVLALRSAYGDCRAKVDGLDEWRAGMD